MQLAAKITQILPIHSGNGKNGKYEKREIIVSPLIEKAKDVCIIVWGNKCKDPTLVKGKLIQIKFYLESSEYNNRWNTQVNAIDTSPLTESGKSSLTIKIQLEDFFLNDATSMNRLEKLRSITRNYFYILGRTNDQYKNLIYIGMEGSLDPFSLPKGSILQIPLQIESKLSFGWKTNLYATSFEIEKKIKRHAYIIIFKHDDFIDMHYLG